MNRLNGKLKVRRSDGEFIGPLRTFRKFWRVAKVAAEKKAALAHAYNLLDPTKPESKTLLDQIKAVNDSHFKNGTD